MKSIYLRKKMLVARNAFQHFGGRRFHRPLWRGGSQRHRADRSDEPDTEAGGSGS